MWIYQPPAATAAAVVVEIVVVVLDASSSSSNHPSKPSKINYVDNIPIQYRMFVPIIVMG